MVSLQENRTPQDSVWASFPSTYNVKGVDYCETYQYTAYSHIKTVFRLWYLFVWWEWRVATLISSTFQEHNPNLLTYQYAPFPQVLIRKVSF